MTISTSYKRAGCPVTNCVSPGWQPVTAISDMFYTGSNDTLSIRYNAEHQRSSRVINHIFPGPTTPVRNITNTDSCYRNTIQLYNSRYFEDQCSSNVKTPLTEEDEARPKSVNRMYSLEGSFLKGPTSLFRKSMNLLKQVKVLLLEDESLATKAKGV